jgi:hypothetical protein
LRLGEEGKMVRDMEKLLKIECPKGVPKVGTDAIEVPRPLKLDLIDIEPCTEQGINVHIDLKLDQLEDPEE